VKFMKYNECYAGWCGISLGVTGGTKQKMKEAKEITHTSIS